MKKYVVKFGKEIKVYQSLIVEVEANNKEEAIKLALEDLYDDILDNEIIWDTAEEIKSEYDETVGDYCKELGESNDKI